MKLHYSDKTIDISITKDKNALSCSANNIRIRTNGSMYNYYYQEFEQFFSEMYIFVNKMTSGQDKSVTKDKKKIYFNLSFFIV